MDKEVREISHFFFCAAPRVCPLCLACFTHFLTQKCTPLSSTYTATALSITFCAFLRGDGPHCCPRRRRPPHWSGANPAARNRIRRWSTLLVRNFPNEKFSFSRSSFARPGSKCFPFGSGWHTAAAGSAMDGDIVSHNFISRIAFHFTHCKALCLGYFPCDAVTF